MTILQNVSLAQSDIQAIQNLINNDHFIQASETCEKLLTSCAEIPSPLHWLYGLSLLLNDQEEEGQAIWMMAMMEGDEEQIQLWTAQLITVLENNATQQENLGNLESAHLIRHHIHMIAPEQGYNVLRLMQLELHSNSLTVESFRALGMLELLQDASLRSEFQAHQDLLARILEEYLENAFDDSITLEFVEAARFHLAAEDFVDIVMPLASMKIGRMRHLASLAAVLLEVCFEVLPQDAEVLRQLIEMCLHASDFERAIDLAQQALNHSSNIVEEVVAGYQLLKGYLDQGRHNDEVKAVAQAQEVRMQRLIESQPNLTYHEARLLIATPFLLPYLADLPESHRTLQTQIIQLCEKAIQSRFAEQFEQYQKHHSHVSCLPQTNQRLRIGYICSCFYNHSVGWLARWLIKHHDQSKFDIYLYSVNTPAKYHPVKTFYANITPNYRDCSGTAEDTAEIIYQDGLDILVDLDSITRDPVLTVMALKPAPIQATWLGWDASGLSTIDYFLADRYVLPENAQAYYQEKIWQLPQSYIAVDGFEVAVPTLRRSDLNIPDDAIVFLSAQRGYKRHPETTKLQLQILKQTPNSYFLIKGISDGHAIRQFFEALADEVGVSMDRLRFLPFATCEEIHRGNMAIADIILDTFPYNGATTTLEALWMERPLVTWVGQQFAARNSYTMLVNAGICEGISWTPEEYVSWGVRLGTDTQLRQQVAWKLRQSKQTAPLWNGKDFAGQIENAYQAMYCQHLKTRV